MGDAETNSKIVLIVVAIFALVAIAYFSVFVLLPIFFVMVVIDIFMRMNYKGKVAAAKAKGGLDTAPDVLDFEARQHEGLIKIAWSVKLPAQAYMDIYRLEGQSSGSLEEIAQRGTCIHSSGLEVTQNLDALFIDYDAPEAVLYYIPVLHGQRVEKRILDYSFLSFYGSVQYTTRRKAVALLGPASRVVHELESAPMSLPDERDDAAKMADEILSSIKARKKMDAQLDAAIQRIRQSADLSETEKAEAIELLETRAEHS